MKKERKAGQKISLFFSVFCYFISLFAVAFAIYWKMEHGTEDPIFASALASIFFFACCGFVLQVIANVNLPDMNMSN